MDKLKQGTEKLKMLRRKKSKKDKMSHPQGGSWTLVDKDDNRIPLDHSSLTVGKNSSDIIPQNSGSSLGQHAVISYDTSQNRFQIKDVGSSSGTYVNDSRIPPEELVTLNNMDSLSFGQESTKYCVQHIMDESQQAPTVAKKTQDLVQQNNDNNKSKYTKTQNTGSIISKKVEVFHQSHKTEQHVQKEYKTEVKTKLIPKAEHSVGVQRQNKIEITTKELKKEALSRENRTSSGEKVTQEQIPVWGSRQMQHIMAECPGCIAEQDIKHTCGGHDDTSPTSPQSIAHNHPVHHHPAARVGQTSWEEPPLRYHRPHHYPPVEYRGYPPPPNAQGNFDDENFLYSPTSHSYALPGQYGGDRRSHEAGESQMKRSKSAHLQFESQGFVPYSRDLYHYPYPPPPSGYPPHAFHPHLHGYYPPPAGPPMYGHYPEQTGHKAKDQGCKTCSSLKAQYGHVPRDHLYNHHMNVHHSEVSNSEMAYQSSNTTAQRRPSMEQNDGVDISPTDQGYVSQSEKIDLSDTQTTSEPPSKSVMDDFFSHAETSKEKESSESEDSKKCTEANLVSSDTPVSSTANYDNINSIFTNTAQVTLSSSVNSSHTTAKTEESSTAATTTHTTISVVSHHLEDSNVDIIPERDTNPSDMIPHRTDQRRGLLDTDVDLETIQKSTPLYGEPAWWGQIENRQLITDSEGEGVAERPNTIGISSSTTKKVQQATPVDVVSKSVHDPTHTPPERDPGPTKPEMTELSNQFDHHQQNFAFQSSDVKVISYDSSNNVSETNNLPTTTLSSDSSPDEIPSKQADILQHTSSVDISPLDSPVKSNCSSTSDSNMNSKTVIVPERTVIMPEQRHSISPPPPRMTDVVIVGKQPDNKTDTKDSPLSETPNKMQAPSGVVWPTKNSMAFTVDFDVEPPSKPAPTNKNAAFTVDMGGDEQSGLSKSLGQSDSLSNFLPHKLRKSFQGRAPKIKTELKAKQEKITGSESDNNPYSSPVSKRRVKGGGTPKTGRRSAGYNSDGGHSAMSSDNEELSMHSEGLQRGSSRKSLPAKPVTTPRGSSTRTRTRTTESTHARTARVLEAMSVEKKLEKRIMRSKSAGLHKANSVDMFSYSAEQSDEQVLSSSYKEKSVDGVPPSEFILYKESKIYDSIIQSKTKNGDGKKKARISSTSRSLTVPNNGDEDVAADDISEAGTYTIEPDQDVQIARQSIDSVFHVPNRFDSLRMVPRRPPLLKKQTTVDSYSSNTDTDINGNVEDVQGLDTVKTGGSVDKDSIENDTISKQGDDDVWHNARENQLEIDIEDKATVTVIEPGRPPYVEPSNLTPTYLNQQELSGSPDLHTLQQASSASPGSGHTRRRRKLPTPPIRNQGDGSIGSPHTPRTSTLEPQLDHDSPGRHRGTVSFSDSDRGIGFTVSFDAPQSHPQSQEVTPEREMVTLRDDDESLVSGIFSSSVATNSSNRYERGRSDTARSDGSMDTEILLKDTEHVVRALEERVERQRLQARDDSLDNEYINDSHRYSPIHKEDLHLNLAGDSDSDTSSTCAVIGKTHKPSNVKTIEVHKPQPKKSSKQTPLSIIKDKSLNHIGGKSGKRLSSSSADFEVFGATDESENESGSVASTGTDYSMSNISSTASPKLQRKGSGKGSIANTRVNRTFALRRSKADGSDTETPKTEVSSTTRSSTRSYKRSVSDKPTPRPSSKSRPSSANNTTRTDASLGQQIVQRSRDNVRSSNKDSKDKSLTRKDGGRGSLRGTKSQAGSSASESRSRSKTDVTTPRSGRSSGGLSVSGSTPKSSQSSKTSNKTEEYKAWQRRHKYDPRKAVADAKAKEKRARSVGNTPEFAETRPRGDTVDSVSSEESGQLDEITKLSSMVATDLNLMTHKHETHTYEVRSSAFTSLASHSNGSAFKSPTKSTSPLYSPVPVKAKQSTQYDPVLLSSIQQLSSQLKSQANKILLKLSERRGEEHGPLDELHCDAVEDASPELSLSLANLRNTEHILKVLEKEMFSDSDDNTQQELERIHNNESAGFRPIPQSRPSKQQPSQSSSKKSSSRSKKSSSKLTYSQESVVSYAGTEYY